MDGTDTAAAGHCPALRRQPIPADPRLLLADSLPAALSDRGGKWGSLIAQGGPCHGGVAKATGPARTIGCSATAESRVSRGRRYMAAVRRSRIQGTVLAYPLRASTRGSVVFSHGLLASASCGRSTSGGPTAGGSYSGAGPTAAGPTRAVLQRGGSATAGVSLSGRVLQRSVSCAAGPKRAGSYSVRDPTRASPTRRGPCGGVYCSGTDTPTM